VEGKYVGQRLNLVQNTDKLPGSEDFQRSYDVHFAAAPGGGINGGDVDLLIFR
jgi:hypothetical protein